MRIPRFYLQTTLAVGEVIILPETAHRHAIQVLRLKLGARLILFNGHDGEYTAQLIEAGRRQSKAEIVDFTPIDTRPSLFISLAQGIAKGERMDYALQKSVELGVSTIQPLFTKRSQNIDDAKRLQNRMQHWQGVIISACEQCHRVDIPALLAPVKLERWLDNNPHADLKLVFTPVANHAFGAIQNMPTSVTVLIGAEGGLDDWELKQAMTASFMPVRLGPRVLRTETAALAALVALQTRFGDYR